VQRDLGRLESKVQALEVDIADVRKDVKEILSIINQTKGSWRTLVLIGGISGAIGAVISKAIPFTMMIPR
jgi:hypothetical protein